MSWPSWLVLSGLWVRRSSWKVRCMSSPSPSAEDKHRICRTQCAHYWQRTCPWTASYYSGRQCNVYCVDLHPACSVRICILWPPHLRLHRVLLGGVLGFFTIIIYRQKEAMTWKKKQSHGNPSAWPYATHLGGNTCLVQCFWCARYNAWPGSCNTTGKQARTSNQLASLTTSGGKRRSANKALVLSRTPASPT